MGTKDPKTVTVYGRLSFPTFTAQEAYDLSLSGDYPAKDVASAAPHFQLLLEQGQFEKLLDHSVNVFLPYVEQQFKDGEKRDALEPKHVKRLLEQLEENRQGNFDGDLNTPFKVVNEKTAELAPASVAAVKVLGSKGVNMDLKAIVRDEDELNVPDEDRIKYPFIAPINETVHELYPGCYAGATLNLYAYLNGKFPGFSAGGGTVVFRQDAERFGGGTDVDEDEMFLDD